MPHRPRIGEILRRSVPLSRQDVDEILEDQKTTRRRFGEIALSWGLCQPEHLWSAWCDQLTDNLQRVNLQELGIDAQAAALISQEDARKLRVVPVRMSETEVIIVADAPLTDPSHDALKVILGRQVKLVLTSAQQLDQALEDYYPTLQQAG